MRRLHEVASPGPWTPAEALGTWLVRGSAGTYEDAALVVALRNALPALLDVVEASVAVEVDATVDPEVPEGWPPLVRLAEALKRLEQV